MDEKTKEYVESCIKIVKQDLKLYKKFKEVDHVYPKIFHYKFWLQDAETQVKLAEKTLRHNLLCSFIRRNK